MGGKVRPQALDSATSSWNTTFWNLLGSLTVFSWCAIFLDLYEGKHNLQLEDEDVKPHSEEIQSEEVVTEQNVTFTDSNAGHIVDFSQYDDPLRSQPLNTDATLDNFFSRPIKIAQFELPIGSFFFQKIDPWSLYFNNERVINRIANYKLMRADLHVKIILNGNSFHYGRMIVAYNPLRLQDQLTTNRAFFNVDVVAASQRPHIFLNPTVSEGGEMKLPFFYYKNLLDVVTGEWNQLGELDFHTINPVKHANGAADPVTVTTFAWAENVRFSIPTSVNPSSIVPQADEYGQKPVSRVAGAVAKMAGWLTKVPVISPFARATEIGATAAGAIATLFGYSSPVMTEYSQYRPVPKTNMANTNLDNDAAKLTVDIKQELSIDPRTVGLPPEDQMNVSCIAQKESFIQSFPWEVETPPETLLFQMVVDPAVHREFNGERHFTAPAFAVMPFKYWRGGMTFRFMVISSGYHKGRLKIVYDPEAGPESAEYNTAYTTIVDISEETDFSIDVGWGQATTWREHAGLNGYQYVQNGVTAPYTSSNVSFGNGTISVYVVNSLTVPNSTINNDIFVNCFVKMMDDFEVCVPTQDYFSKLRISAPAPVEQAMVEPHADGEMNKVEPTKDSSIVQMGNFINPSDVSALFHFGEAIGSFRQILKRYAPYELLKPPPSSAILPYTSLYYRPMYPLTPGYTSSPTSAGYPTGELAAGSYTFVWMTPMKYLSLAYAGMRGGTRYMVDFTPFTLTQSSTNYKGTLSGLVTRNKGSLPTATEHSVAPYETGQIPSDEMNQTPDTYDGCTIFSGVVNNVTSFELPYYSKYRFVPAKRLDVPLSSADVFSDSWTIQLKAYATSRGQRAAMYTAAAEDFSLFWYLGPPIFYVENIYPLT